MLLAGKTPAIWLAVHDDADAQHEPSLPGSSDGFAAALRAGVKDEWAIVVKPAPRADRDVAARRR